MPQVPLIPREVLFGNPGRAAPRISPDGDRLAYLAPSPQGVLNIWVRTLGRQDDTQVTDDRQRGIRSYTWTHDGRHLLYVQDREGDENWHVHLVHAAERSTRDLTPFDGVRAQGVMLDRHHPGQMLVGLNRSDPSIFDVYRVDLDSGEMTLDTKNPGDVVSWVTDANFQIRGAVAKSTEDGSTSLRVRSSPGDRWKVIAHWPFEDNGGPVAFTRDGRAIIAETSEDSDTARLVLLDAETGRILEQLAHDPRCDVGSLLLDPERRVVQAVGFNYQRNEWTLLDPGIADDFALIAEKTRGQFMVTDRDHEDRFWIIADEVDDGPLTWHLYDRHRGCLEVLFANRPELDDYRLAPRDPVLIRTRDGHDMVGFLTLPVDRESRPGPMVLVVHGGPWARDRWGFDPVAQWLANRGYTALQVNFRGSTGYGKSWLNAGNGEWGVGAMQHDLSDAVRWAVDQGYADPARVCIYGGSYGGYATLAGLTFTPELYCCGVDIVGPSNVRTLFESVPPYWKPMKRQLIRRVGDVEADEALNRRISPLYHVDKIRAPLIIAQGANDPRVNIREADQMVEAMRSRGLAVTYVVYPDEGHGFARPENRLDFYGRIEEFLADRLGGRAEPWVQVEGSTAELR
ncbi:MAG: S9 family peptidase [Acidobacteriota bacterium]|nr:S9 family peptidase [Acidobacteriota bacterium]